MAVAARPPRLDAWHVFFVVNLVAGAVRESAFASFVKPGTWGVVQMAGLAAMAAWMLARPTVPVRLTGPAAAYLAALGTFGTVALLSGTWSFRPDTTLSQAVLLAFVVLFVALLLVRRWTTMPQLMLDLRVVYLTVASVIAVGLAVAATGDPRAYFQGVARIQGITGNPNYTGLLAALALVIAPALLADARSRTQRRIVLVAGLLLLVEVVASGSRGALAAGVLGLVTSVVLGAPYRRLRVPVGFFAAALLSIVLVVAPSLLISPTADYQRSAAVGGFTSGRADIWALMIHHWEARPLTGYGYRTTQALALAQENFTAHNSYLSVLVEVGLLGLVPFLLALLFIPLARARRGPASALIGAFASLFVFEFTESSLLGFGNPTASTSWMLLTAIVAAGVAEKRRRDTSEASSEEPVSA